MPIESKAQMGAMHAAKEGKSTLGIPKKVGAEFVAAGKAKPNLPERVKKKYAQGGPIAFQDAGDVRTPAPAVTAPSRPAAARPPMRPPMAQMRAPQIQVAQGAPSTPVMQQPAMVSVPGGAQAPGFEKGGKVCASNAKAFKQNLVETAVNETGPMKLAKGGWVKPSWRRW
jgi:hypothetical protein